MALYVGLMSGTSMDAVDAALVDFTESAPRLLAALSTPWPAGLKSRLAELAEGAKLDAAAFAMLDADVGAHLAVAVNHLLEHATTRSGQVAAVGCHGQTVAHKPDTDPATTLQLGDANLIAERTGITTINDFRRRDMAAGGQGAPLAPAFHAAFLRTERENRVVLNLGGIANITVLPADPGQLVFGFDTGPANCLMDLWARRQLGEDYDQDGAWAASAKSDPDLLSDLLDDPFFARCPPKSTGTQYFSADWLAARVAARPDLAPARIQATLMALTCRTIADEIRRHAPDTARVLTCGGGAHNRVLLQQLAEVSGLAVETTAVHGIDPEWMEAMGFAWLAQRTLAGKTGNLPAVTGAAGPRILGAIHPAG